MKPRWASGSSSILAASETAKPDWVNRCNLKRHAAALPLVAAKRARKRSVSLQRAWSSKTDLKNKLWGLPLWWVAVLLGACAAAQDMPVLAGLEIFAGQGQLSKACRDIVGPWSEYEMLKDPQQNIETKHGLHLVAANLLCVTAGGLVWMGTPCKSWVCLSRAWTQRSKDMPMGPVPAVCRRKQAAYLAKHNKIAEINALIALSAQALGIKWVVEQPLSSLLFHFPPMRSAISRCNAETVSFRMSALGSDSPKPHQAHRHTSVVISFCGCSTSTIESYSHASETTSHT